MPEKLKKLFSFKDFEQGEILLYALAISIFIHYVLAAAVLVIIALAVLINGKYRRTLKSLKYRFVGYAFCLLTALVAAINNNWLGLICSFGAFVIFTTGHFAHSIMTTKTYETCLNLCCVCSYFVSVYVIIERLCFWKVPHYRCSGLFFNPNYLATVIAAVIIICAYKVIARQGNQLFYYITAAICVLPLYFSGSMFIWIEVFIAVAVLLSLTNKHNVLSIFLIIVSFCCAIIYFAPDIIPRFSESSETLQNRLRIWELSIETIKLNPIFGKGFLTYYYMFRDFSPAYPTTHAHNILLEPVLSFGIAGTLILIAFLAFYYKRLLYCKSFLSRSHISALVLTLTAGVFVHSLVDMTMLWIQTAALYAIIMAGVGADEKRLIEIRAQQNNN